MKLSALLTALLSTATAALLLQTASAQNATVCADVDALSAAAASCIATHNCTSLLDIELLKTECDDIKDEQCENIEACHDCEGEIQSLTECMYEATCGEGYFGECVHDDHEHEHEGEVVVDDHDEHDDQHDEHDHDHDQDHDHDHSEDVKTMSNSPSSAAAVVRNCAAALAFAAGFVMIIA